jgi:hypothetical protein
MIYGHRLAFLQGEAEAVEARSVDDALDNCDFPTLWNAISPHTNSTQTFIFNCAIHECTFRKRPRLAEGSYLHLFPAPCMSSVIIPRAPTASMVPMPIDPRAPAFDTGRQVPALKRRPWVLAQLGRPAGASRSSCEGCVKAFSKFPWWQEFQTCFEQKRKKLTLRSMFHSKERSFRPRPFASCGGGEIAEI